jgi:hypothetical protein
MRLKRLVDGLMYFSPSADRGDAYEFRGTNDSMGGIEKDVVKACSGG